MLTEEDRDIVYLDFDDLFGVDDLVELNNMLGKIFAGYFNI